MELFDEKLMKSTTFGDHNLVYSIRIVACNKRYPYIVCHIKLWITRLCYAQEMSHLTVKASCYAFDKHCKNYSSTNIVLHIPRVIFCRLMGCHTKRSITNAKVAPTDMTANAAWMHYLHPNHCQYAVCHKGDITASNQYLRAENQHSHP